MGLDVEMIVGAHGGKVASLADLDRDIADWQGNRASKLRFRSRAS
jgi:hypothetical protein